MFQHHLFQAGLFSLVVWAVASQQLVADTFTHYNSKGKKVTVEARLAGSGQLSVRGPKYHALETANGSLKIVPQAAIIKRVLGKDPKPISHKEMAKEIKDMFPNSHVLIQIEKPYVIGMVLAKKEMNPKTLKLRTVQLKKAGRYFKGVQLKFSKFIRRTKVPVQQIKFPLPVLIFESDDDFNQYASMVTQAQGTSAENIAGFYDPSRNYLNLRIRECKTFATPLHEAIHQQTFNRQILQRLAPLPHWFVEGIACGFEGDGKNIRSGPTTPSPLYSRVSLRARAISWKEVIQYNRAFQGDIFAGEAYGHAWGLHWLLVTKYRKQYAKYVQLLSSKKTLELYSAEDRLKDFEEIIGKDANRLQQQFHKMVTPALNKMKR